MMCFRFLLWFLRVSVYLLRVCLNVLLWFASVVRFACYFKVCSACLVFVCVVFRHIYIYGGCLCVCACVLFVVFFWVCVLFSVCA